MGIRRGRSEGAELEGENKRGGGDGGVFWAPNGIVYRLDAISQGPKNPLHFEGPNPSHMPTV
jgi:hypothetical protein